MASFGSRRRPLSIPRLLPSPVRPHALDPHALAPGAREEVDPDGEADPQDADACEQDPDPEHCLHGAPPNGWPLVARSCQITVTDAARFAAAPGRDAAHRGYVLSPVPLSRAVERVRAAGSPASTTDRRIPSRKWSRMRAFLRVGSTGGAPGSARARHKGGSQTPYSVRSIGAATTAGFSGSFDPSPPIPIQLRYSTPFAKSLRRRAVGFSGRSRRPRLASRSSTLVQAAMPSLWIVRSDGCCGVCQIR